MRETTQATFDADTATGTVIVDCYATWCGPCHRQKTVLEEFEKANPGVQAVAFDVEKEAELAKRFDVRALPTLVIFKNGQQVGETLVGLKSKETLLKAISSDNF